MQLSAANQLQTPSSSQRKSDFSEVGCSNEQLRFLDRELTGGEIVYCEKLAKQFIDTDNVEIEIHNLNEVNEYFRIFREKIRHLTQTIELNSAGVA